MKKCKECTHRTREDLTDMAYCPIHDCKIWIQSVACQDYDDSVIF